MSEGANVRIATRGSKLALWQAHHVRDRLIAAEPGLQVELVVLTTLGDKILDRPLSEVGGKGLFVKEIEAALLDGRADVAVHSMKDLPADLAPGLLIAAVPEREDARDALLVRPELRATVHRVEDLPLGSRVGTSSLRRVCQLKVLRPDLEVTTLRGNVDTRLRKLEEGQVDAIVLATAGLRRLGFADRIAAILDEEASLPAIGQGALAIECREDDPVTRARLLVMNHAPTATETQAERAFLERLSGSCRTPMAAHAKLSGDRLRLAGLVGRPDATLVLRDEIAGAASEALALGRQLAERLIAAGADVILRDAAPPPPAGAA